MWIQSELGNYFFQITEVLGEVAFFFFKAHLDTFTKESTILLNEDIASDFIHILLSLTMLGSNLDLVSIGLYLPMVLFMKYLHMVANNRLDDMEITFSRIRSKHISLTCLIIFLIIFDLRYVNKAYNQFTMDISPTVLLVAEIECALLIIDAATILLKYLFFLSALVGIIKWETKATILLIFQLVVEMCRLMTVAFCCILFLTFLKHPIFLLCKLTGAFVNIMKTTNKFVLLLDHDCLMKKPSSDVRIEDLLDIGHLCIICSRKMTLQNVKKLHFNRIFYTSSSKKWFLTHKLNPAHIPGLEFFIQTNTSEFKGQGYFLHADPEGRVQNIQRC